MPADWPSGAIEQLWTELQTELAALTTQGRIVVAEKSGHRIQELQPALVIEAIQDVVDSARANHAQK